MQIVLYSIGFLVTFLTIIDIVWTTLWVDGGAGPISKKVAELSWYFSKKVSKGRIGLFNFVGPLILVLTLISWVFFMWLGMTLFFSADAQSIINTTTYGPVMWYERVYYVGYTIFTLGIGDYSPQPGFWQIVTAVNSGIGILFLTLGASYVISVINAVVNKRALARTVTGLGSNSTEIIKLAWNGDDFKQLDLVLMNVSAQITRLTQEHHAYPLLHFYHNKKREEASSVAIAVLDDVLSVLHFGIEDKTLMNTTLIKEARSSIDTYLVTLNEAFIREADEAPPLPDTAELMALNIPVVPKETLSERLKACETRRKQLLGAVQSDQHKWPK